MVQVAEVLSVRVEAVRLEELGTTRAVTLLAHFPSPKILKPKPDTSLAVGIPVGSALSRRRSGSPASRPNCCQRARAHLLSVSQSMLLWLLFREVKVRLVGCLDMQVNDCGVWDAGDLALGYLLQKAPPNWITS